MSMSAGKEGRSKVKDEVDSDSDGDENVPLSVSVPKKEHNKEVKRDDEETGISNSKRTVRKAKVEYSSSEEDYGRVLSKRTVLIKDTKATVVKKRGHAGAVREKKTYILPGQKHDPPEERDPLRIFYESLYQQVPTSDMAAIWMMEWGLLQEDEAVAVLEKKKNLQKLKSPFKINTVKKTNSGSAKALKKETTLKANSTAKKITTTKKRKLFNFSSEDENDFVEPTKNLKSSTAKKNTTTKKHKLFDVSSEDENDFVEPTKNLKSSTAKKITTTKKHKIFDGSSEDENNFVEPGKNLKSSTAKKITTTKKHKLFEGSSEGEIDFVAPTKKLKR